MATKKNKGVKFGWHFLPTDMKLEYGDGRKAKVGETLSITSKEAPECCVIGMHASETPSQAAKHKKGPVICRVAVSGDLDVDSDKFCGRHRTVIWAKQITMKEAKAFYKDANSGTEPASYWNIEEVLRYAGGPKFDASIEKWAKQNGWKNDDFVGVRVEKVVYEKQDLDEKTVKKFLSDRMVRTYAEIEKDLQAAYKVDGDSNGDNDLNWILDELISSGDVCRVDLYAQNGDDGYVLKLKRKR